MWLAITAPWAMWFAVPVLAALLLAVPVAVVTTWPRLGAWSVRTGLFDTPEERTARGHGPVSGRPMRRAA